MVLKSRNRTIPEQKISLPIPQHDFQRLSAHEYSDDCFCPEFELNLADFRFALHILIKLFLNIWNYQQMIDNDGQLLNF